MKTKEQNKIEIKEEQLKQVSGGGGGVTCFTTNPEVTTLDPMENCDLCSLKTTCNNQRKGQGIGNNSGKTVEERGVGVTIPSQKHSGKMS